MELFGRSQNFGGGDSLWHVEGRLHLGKSVKRTPADHASTLLRPYLYYTAYAREGGLRECRRCQDVAKCDLRSAQWLIEAEGGYLVVVLTTNIQMRNHGM